MKRFIAFFVLAIAVVFTNTALAAASNNVSIGSAGFDNLTDAQKAEIIAQVAKTAEANKANSPSAASLSKATPEQVVSWVDVGARIGQALGGAAKEVGVAVNDFAQTPVGKVTMAIVVWQYMGGVIAHVLGGMLVIAVGLGMTLFLIRRTYPVTITYDTEKKDIFGRSVIKEKSRVKLSNDDFGGALLMTCVTIAVGLITIFTY